MEDGNYKDGSRDRGWRFPHHGAARWQDIADVRISSAQLLIAQKQTFLALSQQAHGSPLQTSFIQQFAGPLAEGVSDNQQQSSSPPFLRSSELPLALAKGLRQAPDPPNFRAPTSTTLFVFTLFSMFFLCPIFFDFQPNMTPFGSPGGSKINPKTNPKTIRKGT